jgi:hypothetical protein
MQKLHVAAVTAILVAGAGKAQAQKPEWAGDGKPTKEQVEAHKVKMKIKHEHMREQGSATVDNIKNKQMDKVKKQKVEKAGKEVMGGHGDGSHERHVQDELDYHEKKTKKEIKDSILEKEHNVRAKDSKEIENHAEAMARQAEKKAEKMDAMKENDERPESSKKWWQFWR